MMMHRIILHCDMNAFFASVEELYDPGLKTGPMAVCGDPSARHGIILAKNEQAKAYGIITAETVWQARRKCPELMLVRAHHQRYTEYSARAGEIYKRYTDLVEPFSIDESWLDVTGSIGLFGSGVSMADRIRDDVRNELGLTLSVGVSYNKVFAKMGSDYKKPDATTLITPENFQELLWPLPVSRLFFVGEATAGKLKVIGIRTIGQLASADRKTLTDMFGRHGDLICNYANGIDDSPVCTGSHERLRSVGNGMTFKRDLEGHADLKRGCMGLSDSVAGRLRKNGMKCRGVKVDIRDPYFKTISRQKQLDRPCNTAPEIARTAMDIINSAWDPAMPVRMLTITGINLVGENEDEQLAMNLLNGGSHEKSEKMERALDLIRGKYGHKSIAYGGMLADDIGLNAEKDSEDGIIMINEGGQE